MWKVKNTKNEMYLRLFENEIILPILIMIQETVYEVASGQISLPTQSKDIWKYTKTFLVSSDARKRVLTHIMDKTVSRRKLEDLFYEIVMSYNCSYISFIFDLYNRQNSEVNIGNYVISEESICEQFKDIFVEYYYKDFFVDNTVWEAIAGNSYNRSSFHENFRSDNNKLAVCPYCDMDTTVSLSNNNIEHFLPKSKFPLLAMNPLNLISSCIACNKAHEGKGDRISASPIVTPYNEMIGDSADFKVDFSLKSIKLTNKGGAAQDNYFKLLKLYSRYSQPFVFECVDDAARSLFSTLSQFSSPSIDAINLYISSTKERKVNLSFALKSAIINYPQYNSYKV